jgi:hypothetical protein
VVALLDGAFTVKRYRIKGGAVYAHVSRPLDRASLYLIPLSKNPEPPQT